MTSFGQSTKRRVEQPKRSRRKQNSTPRPRVPPSGRFYGIFSEAPSRRPLSPPGRRGRRRRGHCCLAGFLRCWRILANSTIFVFNLSQLFFFFIAFVVDSVACLTAKVRCRSVFARGSGARVTSESLNWKHAKQTKERSWRRRHRLNSSASPETSTVPKRRAGFKRAKPLFFFFFFYRLR